jgi:PKD domain/L,D-transpeptidase catalytic domain/Putative peptidoglycan binding domain
MRRRLLLLGSVALLGGVGTASAKPPTLTIQASVVRGAAPLAVTLTAAGDAVAYRWDLGDGTSADGPVVQHTFARGGSYLVTVTGTDSDGQATTAQVRIASLAVSLRAPRVATFGQPVRFRGRILPGARGVRVALRQGGEIVARGRTRVGGSFRLRTRLRSQAPFEVQFEDAVSPAATIVMRPLIRASVQGSGLVGRPLSLSARVVPMVAGKLRVRIRRGGRRLVDKTFFGPVRLRLDTKAPRRLEIQLSTAPAPGFAAARRTLGALVQLPSLALGSRGPGVSLLQQRLLELHFALPGVSGIYSDRTYEAVLALQKLLGVPRTGRMTPGLWLRLQRMAAPRPRYPGGTHVEVDKGRQLLFDVVGGKLKRIVHVSTGATGNTPLGVFHVYSKLAGFNALSMYYSLFFLRGFAIHGYPSVPPYPASHGCVRTPLWIAPTIYVEHGYGTTIFVY